VKDNAKVLGSHFTNIFNRSTTRLTSAVEQSVLELLPQLPTMEELADEPSAAEVAEHLKKVRRVKAPAESGLAVECLQAFADDVEALDAVRAWRRASRLDFWRSETACFEEWRRGRLRLLPNEKGDLSDPSNWRGIMLLSAMAKVVASVVESRLARLLQVLGMIWCPSYPRQCVLCH
jgi:hypothetical protein